MQSFRINLFPLLKKYKYQPYLFTVMGVLYIISGVIRLNSIHSEPIDWIWVLGGLFFLLGSYYQQKIQSQYFFEITEDFVQIRQNISKPSKYLFSNIKAIDFKPISIQLTFSDGNTEEISLANVGYKNVIEIKEKLREVAALKGITIQ